MWQPARVSDGDRGHDAQTSSSGILRRYGLDRAGGRIDRGPGRGCSDPPWHRCSHERTKCPLWFLSLRGAQLASEEINDCRRRRRPQDRDQFGRQPGRTGRGRFGDAPPDRPGQGRFHHRRRFELGDARHAAGRRGCRRACCSTPPRPIRRSPMAPVSAASSGRSATIRPTRTAR